jgi:hypothetical protein
MVVPPIFVLEHYRRSGRLRNGVLGLNAPIAAPDAMALSAFARIRQGAPARDSPKAPLP